MEENKIPTAEEFDKNCTLFKNSEKMIELMNNLRFKLEDKVIHVEYGEGKIVGINSKIPTSKYGVYRPYIILFNNQEKLKVNYLGFNVLYIKNLWKKEIEEDLLKLSNINNDNRLIWIKEDEDLKAL